MALLVLPYSFDPLMPFSLKAVSSANLGLLHRLLRRPFLYIVGRPSRSPITSSARQFYSSYSDYTHCFIFIYLIDRGQCLRHSSVTAFSTQPRGDSWLLPLLTSWPGHRRTTIPQPPRRPPGPTKRTAIPVVHTKLLRTASWISLPPRYGVIARPRNTRESSASWRRLQQLRRRGGELKVVNLASLTPPNRSLCVCNDGHLLGLDERISSLAMSSEDSSATSCSLSLTYYADISPYSQYSIVISLLLRKLSAPSPVTPG